MMMKKNKGLTIIEIVIYVALLGIVIVFVVNALMQISDVYARARAEREVIANGRLILETIAQTAGEAQEIYGSTSVFLNDLGQLSLITPIDPPSEHETAYLDFYVDNGRLWIKKDGESARTLSASSVRITEFRLMRIMQGRNHEAVKISLTVDSALSRYPTSISLTTTISLRGNY